jgi:trimeric autotransporter adhesin
MSTKTLRKRIALVAVATLGAGVLICCSSECRTVYVVASCSGDSYSAAYSYAAALPLGTANDQETVTWTPTNVDTSGATTVVNGEYGYLKVALNDVYGASLVANGALIATTTGTNCVVGLAAYDGALVPGKGTTAVLSAPGNDHVAVVGQATADVASACTVTVSFNGTVVGTRTYTIQGAPASITVSDVTVGRTSDYGYYRVTVQDAAGNLLPGKEISASSTNADNVASVAVVSNAQSRSGAVTSSTSGSGYGKTKAVAYADIADANMTRFSCTSKGGAAKITVRTGIDSANSAYVTSAPFSVLCGGALATWSISMDKASYAPGELATLTLSGKDSSGNAVSTFTLLSGVAASLGGMTAVTAPTDNDAFSSGIGTKTYTYSVGTSEGAFVGTFKTTGSTDTSAKTVQYTVKSTSTAVSNADVLKAIVSLIASINKQIAALQKALLRR